MRSHDNITMVSSPAVIAIAFTFGFVSTPTDGLKLPDCSAVRRSTFE
jgi:hypothetical protein